MTDHVQADPAGESSSTSSGPVLAFLIAGSMGALIGLVVAPIWSPSLTATLLGPSPKAYWYLSRASAFVALGLLWLSMMLGLLITDKISRSWPGAQAAFALHEYVSLLGLAFVGFHALILLGDHYIGYQLAQILIPFASQVYRPFWVGLGQVGLYVWAIVAITFYIRKGIGQSAWKLIHYASFFMFVVAIMHGLASGTDSASPWAQGAYWLMGASFFFLTVYRVVAGLSTPEDHRLPQTGQKGGPAHEAVTD
jgi:predicted ferric reductase